MKKRAIRLLAFALAAVLCVPMLPGRAEAISVTELVKKYAGEDAVQGQSVKTNKSTPAGLTGKNGSSSSSETKSSGSKMQTTTISGTMKGDWSDETFRRGTNDINFFELDEEIYSCVGFTMEYEILEVYKGKMLSGDFIFEVYVRTTGGDWKSVDSFYLKEEYKTTVKVNFDNPISIDAVAVVCGKKADFEFVYSFTVRDAVCKKSSLPTSGCLSGQWWEESFRRGDFYTHPFELNSALTRCKGFTLHYEITEVTKGTLEGNYRWSVYVRTTGGDWKYVTDFKLEGYDISVDVRFDPMSIDAVAVFCGKKDKLNYSYNFAITDPV